MKGKPAKPNRAAALQLLQQLLQHHMASTEGLPSANACVDTCCSVLGSGEGMIRTTYSRGRSGEQSGQVDAGIDAVSALPAIVVRVAGDQSISDQYQTPDAPITAAIQSRRNHAAAINKRAKHRFRRQAAHKAQPDVLLLTEKQHQQMQQEAGDESCELSSHVAPGAQQRHMPKPDSDAAIAVCTAASGQLDQHVQPIASRTASCIGQASVRASELAESMQQQVTEQQSTLSQQVAIPSQQQLGNVPAPPYSSQLQQAHQLPETRQTHQLPETRQTHQVPGIRQLSAAHQLSHAQQQLRACQMQDSPDLQEAQQLQPPTQQAALTVGQEACHGQSDSIHQVHGASQDWHGESEQHLQMQPSDLSGELQGGTEQHSQVQPLETTQVLQVPCKQHSEAQAPEPNQELPELQQAGPQEESTQRNKADALLWQRLHDCMADKASANKLAHCTVTLLARM